MNGVVTGGWEFVWAAYALTAAGLLLYAGSLFGRYRKEVLSESEETEERR